MPTDPFEQDDKRERLARGVMQGVNIAWSLGLGAVGLILVILGAESIGGAIAILLGCLALVAAVYNLLRSSRV